MNTLIAAMVIHQAVQTMVLICLIMHYTKTLKFISQLIDFVSNKK